MTPISFDVPRDDLPSFRQSPRLVAAGDSESWGELRFSREDWTLFSPLSYDRSYPRHCEVIGMSCPSWQWHRAGYRWSPVRTVPVAPLWCDLGSWSRTVVVIKLRRTSAFIECRDWLKLTFSSKQKNQGKNNPLTAPTDRSIMRNDSLQSLYLANARHCKWLTDGQSFTCACHCLALCRAASYSNRAGLRWFWWGGNRQHPGLLIIIAWKYAQAAALALGGSTLMELGGAAGSWVPGPLCTGGQQRSSVQVEWNVTRPAKASG